MITVAQTLALMDYYLADYHYDLAKAAATDTFALFACQAEARRHWTRVRLEHNAAKAERKRRNRHRTRGK